MFYFLLIITDLDQPRITSPDTRPVEGTDVSLSCFDDGKPTPTVSWTVNGSPLNTSRNSRVRVQCKTIFFPFNYNSYEITCEIVR